MFFDNLLQSTACTFKLKNNSNTVLGAIISNGDKFTFGYFTSFLLPVITHLHENQTC